ncbi:hypothetical protein PsorP6_001474 [Peronosclerospora sorghi]|uniref:Uncharacterized protein n=1 Tax=Peronosclerospora sorghi TaxID=230839 RepID=A0ACC0WW29_9STRA|nr:hypothetical protein PsorP6_001474 [Peronosclerospora sorghi]
MSQGVKFSAHSSSPASEPCNNTSLGSALVAGKAPNSCGIEDDNSLVTTVSSISFSDAENMPLISDVIPRQRCWTSASPIIATCSRAQKAPIRISADRESKMQRLDIVFLEELTQDVGKKGCAIVKIESLIHYELKACKKLIDIFERAEH